MNTEKIPAVKFRQYQGNIETKAGADSGKAHDALKKVKRDKALLADAKTRIIKKAEEHYNAGLELKKEKKFQEALDELSKAVKIDPDYIPAYTEAARILAFCGRPDMALHIIQKEVLIRDTNNISGRDLLGYIYLQRGMAEEALAQYNKIIEIDPDDARGHMGKGNVYFLTGRTDEALAVFKELIKTGSKNNDPEVTAEIYKGIGCIYAFEKMFEEAVLNLNKSIEINSKDIAVHISLASCYLAQGKLEKAREVLEKALKLFPDSDKICTTIGITYYLEKDYDKAFEYFMQSLKINQNNGETHYGLSKVYYERQEYSNAIKHCKEALRLKYEVPEEFIENLENIENEKLEEAMAGKLTSRDAR
ncbi:MAG: tetratricopeptide repeat protein [Armatimonadota bacterium]